MGEPTNNNQPTTTSLPRIIPSSTAPATATATATAATKTIHTYLSGYQTLSVDRLLQPLSPDFHQRVLPRSLGVPEVDRSGFARDAAGMFGLFREFRIVPRLIVVGAGAQDATTTGENVEEEGEAKKNEDGAEEEGALVVGEAKEEEEEEEEATGSLVVVHASMLGTLREERGGGKWENECVMMIRLSADDSQVLRVDEFVDSARALEMMKLHAHS